MAKTPTPKKKGSGWRTKTAFGLAALGLGVGYFALQNDDTPEEEAPGASDEAIAALEGKPGVKIEDRIIYDETVKFYPVKIDFSVSFKSGKTSPYTIKAGSCVEHWVGEPNEGGLIFIRAEDLDNDDGVKGPTQQIGFAPASKLGKPARRIMDNGNVVEADVNICTATILSPGSP